MTLIPRWKREKILAQYGSLCVYCGKELTELTMAVDHYVPRSRGGSNGLWNLRPSCLPCNANKADAMPKFRDGYSVGQPKLTRSLSELIDEKIQENEWHEF